MLTCPLQKELQKESHQMSDFLRKGLVAWQHFNNHPAKTEEIPHNFDLYATMGLALGELRRLMGL